MLQVRGNKVILLQRKVSCTAKLVESLAYSCDNEVNLIKLLDKINQVANDFKGSLRRISSPIIIVY